MTAAEKKAGRKRSAEMQGETMQVDERPSQKVARIEVPEVVSLQKAPLVILIDDDDDGEYEEIEEIQPSQPQQQLQKVPSITSTSRLRQNVNQFAESLGVKFYESTYTMTQIRAYRQGYSRQFKEMDGKITDHYLTNRQSPQIYMIKTAALQEMYRVIRPIFPNHTVRMHPVGSTVNGCGSYNSDMDVCISLESRNGQPGFFKMDKSFMLKSLSQICHVFKTNHNMRRCIANVEVVSSAKVPIIKMKMSGEYDGMEVDMNVNSIAGISNSFLMHYYSRVDERFPELCLLIKHWAIKNGISDAMNGTFNSYSLLLLVVHYLQCGVSPPVLPNLQHLYPQKFTPRPDLDSLRLEEELVPPFPDFEKNTATPGELLCGFFHYYVNFPWDTDAPSIHQGQRISRRFLDQDLDRYYIYIEEPFDKENTARCVQQPDKFRRIIQAFEHASTVLSTRPPSLANIDVIC